MNYNPHSDNPFNPDEGKKRKLKVRGKNLMYSVFVVSMVCVVLFCGFVFVNKHFNDYITEKEYEDLRGPAPTPNPSREAGGFDNVPFPDILFDPSQSVIPQRPTTQYVPTDIEKGDGYVNRQNQVWDIYEDQNSDVRGWLYIPEVVNYPFFMDDNDYYLDHDMNHNKSDAGALFMSSLNSLNPLGPNTIIHGHNMTRETMFGKLKYYTTFGTQAFFDNHRRVYVDTLYGTYRFEIFSVYITNREDPDYRSHYFASEQEYVAYLNRIRDRGMFKDESFEFTPYDRVLTLSTCNSDEGSTKRTIVHARLVWPTPNTQDKPQLLPTTPAPTVDPGSTADPNTTNDPNVTVTPDVSNLRVVKLNDSTVPLKLRSRPSTSSDILDNLDHGTVLTVVEDFDQWVKVRVNGKEGYVYKIYTVPYSEFDFGVVPQPSVEPTVSPTQPGQTVEPTDTVTPDVTADPNQPTDAPTDAPTDMPTDMPTDIPTDDPTDIPTDEPTQEPTGEPTDEPTQEPTEEPTDEPTEEPTEQLPLQPTQEPSREPTEAPVVQPTDHPSEPADANTDQ